MVFSENSSKELVLGVTDCLDNEPVVLRKVEEAPALSGRAELREDVPAGKRHEVIRRIQSRVFAKRPEDPGGIILELEVILGGGGHLISVAAVIICSEGTCQ